MKPILAAIAACVLAVTAAPFEANATTITFGTFNGSGIEVIGNSYIEKGFNFFNGSGLARWENGSAYDSDPTSSTGLITYYNLSETIINRGGGGAFDLLSIDLDDVYNQGFPSGILNYDY